MQGNGPDEWFAVLGDSEHASADRCVAILPRVVFASGVVVTYSSVESGCGVILLVTVIDELIRSLEFYSVWQSRALC